MTWQIPWVISGVTEVPLGVSRVIAYAATGGNEGVVGSTDLEVKALSTPGTSVNVRGGAFGCLNRFTSSSNESYVGYNIGDDTVGITAAGAGGRSDLVYAAIIDPGQPSNPVTPAPVQTKVIQGVSNTVTALNQVPGYANVAGYALARIDIPASTSVIQQSYIKDLRQLLIRRQQREVRINSVDTNTGEVVLTTVTAGSYIVAHPASAWNITIPSWATRMAMVGHVNGLQVSGTVTQEFNGRMRLKGGTSYSSPTYMNFGLTAGTVDSASTLVAEDVLIPTADRGVLSTFRFEMYKAAGAATLKSTTASAWVLDVTFYNTTESGA